MRSHHAHGAEQVNELEPVLTEIEHCRELGMRWYYLGLWVEDCSALRYKSGYHPHERLIGGQWVAQSR